MADSDGPTLRPSDEAYKPPLGDLAILLERSQVATIRQTVSVRERLVWTKNRSGQLTGTKYTLTRLGLINKALRDRGSPGLVTYLLALLFLVATALLGWRFGLFGLLVAVAALKPMSWVFFPIEARLQPWLDEKYNERSEVIFEAQHAPVAPAPKRPPQAMLSEAPPMPSFTWVDGGESPGVQKVPIVERRPSEEDVLRVGEIADRIRAELGAIQLDPLLAIELSSLFESGVEASDRFWEAWISFLDLHAEGKATLGDAHEVEAVWDLAYNTAKFTGLSYLGTDKRELAERTLKVLRKADPAANPNKFEAKAAMVMAADLLAELNLIHFPPEAIAEAIGGRLRAIESDDPA